MWLFFFYILLGFTSCKNNSLESVLRHSICGPRVALETDMERKKNLRGLSRGKK